MALSHTEKKRLLAKISTLVEEKYYDPSFGGRDWKRIVAEHSDAVVTAETDETFEVAVSNMLDQLHCSGFGLLGPTTKITPRNAINASFRRIETSTDGICWVFQDVLPGGVAHRGGVEPGDALLSADGKALASSPPAFPMGRMFGVVISRRGERRETQLDLATQRPKYKDNPYSEPDSIVGRVAADSLGEVKVSLFPGTIGIDFAKQVDQVFTVKVPDVRRLVLDLRGNPGGGIGGLHLMSYLTPSKLPIGYSVDRQAMERGFDKSSLPKFDHIPKSKMEIPLLFLRLFGKKSILLQTEGLGSKSFHSRIVVLVNEHTTGAAEMVAQFVQENGLGSIAGIKTPGRLVTRSAFKIGRGYRLVIPIAAYMSWKGNRIEGEGLTPDVKVDWSYQDALRGVDSQLSEAIQLARAL